MICKILCQCRTVLRESATIHSKVIISHARTYNCRTTPRWFYKYQSLLRLSTSARLRGTNSMLRTIWIVERCIENTIGIYFIMNSWEHTCGQPTQCAWRRWWPQCSVQHQEPVFWYIYVLLPAFFRTLQFAQKCHRSGSIVRES